MTRDDLLFHVNAVLEALAQEANVSLTDDWGGIERQLDAAVRDLGADTNNVMAGEALIEYHVLRRIRYAVASRVDFDATAMRGGRSQIYQHVSDLLADAAARAAAGGHPVIATAGQPQGAQLVGLNLNYLDAAPEGYA